MLGKKKKSIVGLDIGSSALKAVELKQTRNGFELVHIAHQNLQSDTIVDGHIIDLNHVSDTISRVWNDQHIKTDQVATSLSGHAVIVKKILLPSMPEEELDEQIHWEAEQYIPFENASAGQQATTLLHVLLRQHGPPLIIDQPEDDLDNEVVLQVALHGPDQARWVPQAE